MEQIVNIDEVIKLSDKFRKQGKMVVLAGGCFDILHLGHVEFLERAKAQGDILMIMLESDETIKKIKGDNRPVNSQEHRAKMLASLRMVDYVVMLPEMNEDKDYREIVLKINPKIIAVTAGDVQIKKKQAQAKLIGAEVREVADAVPQKSTTAILEIITRDF